MSTTVAVGDTFQNFTYTKLMDLIPAYAERRDNTFMANLPVFVTLAENRIATDMKQQGFQAVLTGYLPLDGVLQKPAFWRETLSFYYTGADGKRNPLLLRSLEFLNNYWPDPSLKDLPKFYADYNAKNFKIVPTPVAAFPFELACMVRLDPLGEENESNWITTNAPQALLYACMIEAQLFLKNESKAQFWKAAYDDVRGGFSAESAERLNDRSSLVVKG